MIIGSAPVLIVLLLLVIARPPCCHLLSAVQVQQSNISGEVEEEE
jgi:hypothetical protein